MTPTRVQLRRVKGWRMPPDTVKVDRSTPYGNPFVVGTHGTRAQCVAAFVRLLSGHPTLSVDKACLATQWRVLESLQRDQALLRGKNLACWCTPEDACHADELLKVLNR